MRHIIVDIRKYEVAGTEILSDISCVINATDRIAIVGGNGVGKTSFMRILTGEIPNEADELAQKRRDLHENRAPEWAVQTGTANEDAQIWVQRSSFSAGSFHGKIDNIGSISTGYLAQIHFDEEARSVREELRLAFTEVREAEAALARAEEYMAEHPGDMDAIEAYTTELDRFQMLGGYETENRIERVARGIGIFELLERKISEVSGGQRTKIALAKILLSAPEFLLLDEPTNFIDLQSVEWLEKYLQDTWKWGYMIISHDREFLDRTCNTVYEVIPNRPIRVYHGNYTYYVEEKSKIAERAWKLYEEQQTFLASEKALINRFRAGSRAGFAKSREKALDRVEIIDKPYVPSRTTFFFEFAGESSEKVLSFKECFIGRSDPLFYIRDLVLYSHERVGIVGENGVGKSTFLKTILGQLEVLDGYFQKGKEMSVSYYSQMHEELEQDKTLVENFLRHGIVYPRERLAALIGYYGLSFADLDRKISSFSWGQISKILFAILGQKPSNVLILDEPTNHLDYDSRESLEESLRKYPGTILFISHDRYFVNKIASKLWIIEDGDLVVSYGNYEDFRYKKEYGLSLDASLYDDSAELQMVLEEKLGKEEAKRIAAKYSRGKKK